MCSNHCQRTPYNSICFPSTDGQILIMLARQRCGRKGRFMSQQLNNESQKRYRNKAYFANTDKPRTDVSQIITSLEQDFSSFLKQDENRYQEYLRTMARFHKYSVNNTMLIFLQRPEASYINSYSGWKSVGRMVKKGEKGIRIIAPVTIKVQKEAENDSSNLEKIKEKVIAFRTAYVFDLSQTEGKELPLLNNKELIGNVSQYAKIMDAIRQIAPVPIQFGEISSETKGYYDYTNRIIMIRDGMSELHTVKTAIHELTHALLHSDKNIGKNSYVKETEAESVAYVVCNALGLDTEEYSFPYLASCSENHTPHELKNSLFIIRRTADSLINKICEKVNTQDHVNS